MRRRAWAALLAAATLPVVAGLAGCGFQLRQPPKLHFASIALVGFEPRSPLAEELKRRLAQQVRVLDAPDKADVVLQAIEDRAERGIVASTSAAQVREMELRRRLVFSAHSPGGRELIPRAELLAKRDLSYNETAALAKEVEEAELVRDMLADIAAQVMRRLAAVVV